MATHPMPPSLMAILRFGYSTAQPDHNHSAAETREMELLSIHPGSDVEEVLDAMSFRPVIPDEVPTTEPPSAEQVRLIRDEIDPNHILLIA